jgi:hypothetical protein
VRQEADEASVVFRITVVSLKPTMTSAKASIPSFITVLTT